MKNREELEQFEKLIGQLRGLHEEICLLAKKSPNDAVNAFKQQGNEAVLREYAGVRHTATDAMHEDLRADMQKALKT